MNSTSDHAKQRHLIEAMRRPAFYPHETDREIRLVQTHLSYVLLTGPFAYKINKALRLSFVDYSTLGLRGHYCREEVRLNTLYAPDLYLNVVPLYESPSGFSLDATGGEPIEYAVKMRQFRDADLLTHVFERNELTLDRIAVIARRLAGFHRTAESNADVASFGEPAVVEAVMQDTLSNLAGSTGPRWSPAELDTLRNETLRLFEDLRPMFEQRVAAGAVRECHGDLHLGNICLYKGRIEFFDRIVFNDAFKNIDVMYDLAFLYMDLEFRGRTDLANRLLNVYLEETNDFAGVKLLRFYAGCRAQIRAKVFAIEAEEEETPAADRPAMDREARAYFDLALRYAAPRSPEQVTIMCGVAGSGKSTIARKLSTRNGAVCIRSDAVRKHLAIPGGDLYSDAMTDRTYRFLVDEGVALAAAGIPPILDATYLQRRHRLGVLQACRDRRLGVRVLHCHADTNTLSNRVRTRVGDLSDADASVLQRQLAEFEAFEEDEQANVTVLDTTRPVDYEAL